MPGANDFRNIGPAEKCQCQDAHHIAVAHADRIGHHVKENQDLHQQRRAADQFHINPGEITQRQKAAAPGQGRKHADDYA